MHVTRLSWKALLSLLHGYVVRERYNYFSLNDQKQKWWWLALKWDARLPSEHPSPYQGRAGAGSAVNFLAPACKRAWKRCLPSQGIHLLQCHNVQSRSWKTFSTKCPNKRQEWCSSTQGTDKKKKKKLALGNHFWIKINASSTPWVWLKNQHFLPPPITISVTSMLVAALQTFPGLFFSSAHCRFPELQWT